MTTATVPPLAALYEQDETAWLEAMAELVRQRRLGELDLVHLAEYLTDMARRDRREVVSRLRILLAHILTWEYQPDQRSGSWHRSILEQQKELAADTERGVLRNHAEDVLNNCYQDAIELAAAETGLPASAFPSVCLYSLDQLLTYSPTGPQH